MTTAVSQQSQGNALAWINNPSTLATLKTACARHVTPERLARVVLTAANRQPKLLSCTKESIWQSVLDCAAMGLEPDAWGRAYLVPYEDRRNNRVLCQLIIGYKGLVELAMRSGRVKSIKSEVVYERDEFAYAFGLNERMDHIPAQGDRGRATHAYAYAILTDGGHVFEVLSVADVERVRSRSKGGQSGPWQTDWEMMARKTAIRRLAKMLPLSSEFRDAVERDPGGDEDLIPLETTVAGDAPPTIDTTAQRLDEPPAPPSDPTPSEPAPATAPSAPKSNPFVKA
jgi:recombination protein RecT